MSSSNRPTSKGGKSTKADTTKTQKSEKTDTQKLEKNKSGKGSGDKNQSQQNSESIRNAKYKDLRTEDPSMKEKVGAVIELTQRSEEDVCFALHECGFDTNLAVNMLLESTDQEWVTSVKKKKNRQAASTNKTEGATEAGTDEWQESAPVPTNEREKSRTRGGGPPRMRGRGWRGRESRENEKNLEGGELGRRGGRMSNGPTRGGGSGRGGRGGGRLGSRTFQSRDGGGRGPSRPTMDTWNNSAAANPSTEPENWDNDFPSPIDDWYNEEYTGSLTETKVFTPSTAMEDAAAAAAAEKTSALNTTPPVAPVVEVLEMAVPTAAPSATLTAAQSQYLSQLTQQNVDAVPVVQPHIQDQACKITDPVQQSLPARTKTQRARVPPPSKIPAQAVEMPGDLNASVGYLDVQFGALDFMDGTSFDGVSDKFSAPANCAVETPPPPASLDLSASQPPPQSTINSAMLASSAESELSYAQSRAQPPVNATTLDIKQQDYSQPQSNSYQSYQKSTTSVYPPNYTNSYTTSTTTYGSSQPSNSYANSNSYTASNNYQNNSYSSTAGFPSISQAASYPASAAVTQTSYQPSTPNVQSVISNSSYNDYSQPQSNSYQSYQKSTTSVYPPNYTNSYTTSTTTYGSSQPSNSYANSNSYTASNNYQNNSYSSTAGFPSISQAASYPASAAVTQTSYQPSTPNVQSVYGGAGLSNNSSYNNSQYSSYNASSTHNHKISAGKEQTYDNTTTSSSTAAPVTTASVSASPALGLTNSQTSSVSAGTKSTTSSTAKSGVVANIPPGVAPMMGTQYIMGQAGMPYFQQPMYSYEDLQLLQQRVPPHIGAAYYDIGYQTPTTLATGREASIASGAYSMSDSRFTRDTNASPVPSTLSQQTSTQSHQAQPMLSATLPPGYAYFYNAAGMMPGSFQYGTPAIYPQMPAATNAHGSTNLSQYPKPSNYGSGYGSGYDALSQSQDYAKSGYVSGTQTQSKAGQVGNNAVTTGSSVATDLSVMYGKSHAALGKVNSYEKQGFHSGTPPPFNLAGNQSAGIAPSGTYGPQMYIPTMPQQHHHSTTLMHQPLHQMDMRHQTRRMDSGNSTGQRSQSSSQAKTGAKQSYPNSYWNPA